jgi:hypothetical protein
LYKAFGVLFSVPFQIDGMIESIGEPEIKISFGDTPEKLENVEKKGVLFQVNKEGFLFELNNVARYWAKNSGEVIVTKSQSASTDDVIVFLFSSVFAYLLQNKGVLTLHANVVYKNNKAFLIAGHSGAGKSTLTYALIKNGYSFYSDDIAPIYFDNQEPVTSPGLPRLKLWQDALNTFSINNNNLKPIRNQLEKYYLPVIIDNTIENLKVKKMLVIAMHNKDNFEVEKLTGSKKFTALKANTYRYQFLTNENGIQPHFLLSSQLVSKIDIYRITRPNFGFRIEEFQKEVENILEDG